MCLDRERNGMPVEKIELEIENGDAPVVRADLRSVSPGDEAPVIIVAHGFLAYKGWGFFPYLSEMIAQAGFHVLTISFSLCGTDEETGLITRPGEFARNTVSREIADLASTCRFASSPSFPFNAEKGCSGMLGHSRGGCDCILTAPRFSEVRSIVTWSAPSNLDRYTDRRKREWRRTGRLPFTDARSEAPLWLDYSYYEDIDRNREAFDLPARAAGMSIPHLVVHGERDAAVSIREAQRYLELPGGGRVKMTVVKGCGHTFGIGHPMRRPTPELDSAIEATTRWFRSTLAQGRKEKS